MLSVSIMIVGFGANTYCAFFLSVSSRILIVLLHYL